MPDPPKPKSLREIMMDVAYSGIMPQIRKDQVTQYFHPEQDIFPKTKERPSSLTTNNPYEWRSLKDRYPTSMALPSYFEGMSKNDIQYPYKLKDSFGMPGNKEAIQSITPGKGLLFNEGIDLGKRLGLGESTRSIGLDPKTGQPYLSVYDLWDFQGDPTALAAMGSNTPYNIYDRTPIQMQGDKYPANIYTNPRAKDINLPFEPTSGIGPSKKVIKK